MLSKAGGTVTVGEPSRTLSAEHDPMLESRPRQLHDEPRSGGNQPAHQSMINRRPMIVPPALLRGGHLQRNAEKKGEGFLRLQLEMANMRVSQFECIPDCVGG
jgi:hypothetical protein